MPVTALLLLACAHAALVPPPPGVGHNVRDHGAVGDGVALDSPAVQAAVDACAAAGGGTVLFPAGVYVCGTVRLKSGVMLWLDHGATILGSRRRAHYDDYETLDFKNDADHETSYFNLALIRAEGAERIGIAGFGVVDSNFQKRGGPKALSFKRCRFVEIHGITLRNIPNYAVSLLGTDDVNMDGVTILNGYSDGIDPDACRNVRISNCRISTIDDAIVPKASFSLGERRACENITVTNCVLSTVCNGFKLGTESGGDFRRITFSNSVVTGYGDHRPAISGVSIESVDGAHIRDIAVSNITMHHVRSPLFVRLGNRGRDLPEPVPGSIERVVVSNITATGASLPCIIAGIPGHPVRGVTVSGLRAAWKGADPALAPGEAVPEEEASYPDAYMFGPLPAYGLYCRHAEDIVLENLRLSWEEGFWRLGVTRKYAGVKWPPDYGMPDPAAPGDPGPAAWFEDTARLRMSGFDARPAPDGAPLARFHEVRSALVSACAPEAGAPVFVDVTGGGTRGVLLTGNLVPEGTVPFAASPEVPADAVCLQDAVKSAPAGANP